MFAGTLEPRKNLDVLLQALNAPGDTANLVIAGPQGWGEIGERVARSTSDRLPVLGSLDREDLLAAMTLARAVCMPSLAEGFGLPALEAMAQGTPVLHSDCEALCEVVGDTGQKLASDDVAGWSRAMTEFCIDSALSDELGHHAQVRSQQFTWKAAATAMYAVYEELR